MDEGPASPYPCMINPAVFLLRNSASGRSLLRAWEAHQSDQKEVFGEQHSLNLLQQQRPELIEVVGGQVMNTHSSFGSRLLTTSDPRVAYDIALRISSSYMPFIAQDPRLNHSKYQQVALEAFGAPLDFKAPHSASDSLRDRLQNGLGECIEDPTAFVCHGFATRRTSRSLWCNGLRGLAAHGSNDAASEPAGPRIWDSQPANCCNLALRHPPTIL